MALAALLLFSFLLGSIPFGYVAGRLFGSVDIRKHGSGNIGATNVVRTLGRLPGAFVFLADVLKGAAPVVVAAAWGHPPWAVAAAGILAVCGHVWSVFLNFNGGKGIATAFGVMFALDPAAAGALFLIWLVVVFLTRYVSLASLVGAVSFPILLLLFGHPTAVIVGGVALSLIAIWRHRSNISRLLAGCEYRIGESATSKATRQ